MITLLIEETEEGFLVRKGARILDEPGTWIQFNKQFPPSDVVIFNKNTYDLTRALETYLDEKIKKEEPEEPPKP